MEYLKSIFHKVRRILAKFWLVANFQVKTIAITGSFGKTSTACAIFSVLSEQYRGIMTDLNLDTIYNVPMTALKVRPWHKFVIFELGVDKIGEMDFHLNIIKPQIAVITGITPVHSDKEHLKSLAGILKEKGRLLETLADKETAVLNDDEILVRKMSQKTKAKILWYGKDNRHCQFWPEEIKSSIKGLSFIINTPSGKIEITNQQLGEHQVYNCLAAAAVGTQLGLDLKTIKRGLKKLVPLKGRLNFENGPRGTLLLNDSLRANPVSVLAGLKFLSSIKGKRKIAVLGEMGELGDQQIKAHQEIGIIASKLKIDDFVCVGPLQKYTASALVKNGLPSPRVFWVKDVEEAAEVLKKILRSGDILYLKGSLLRHMERVVYLLQGKDISCERVSCHQYEPCSRCPNL